MSAKFFYAEQTPSITGLYEITDISYTVLQQRIIWVFFIGCIVSLMYIFRYDKYLGLWTIFNFMGIYFFILTFYSFLRVGENYFYVMMMLAILFVPLLYQNLKEVENEQRD